MTHATLKYYDGNVYLETDGNPVAVEITYKGDFSGESNLPNGFLITGNKGKLLIVRITNQPFPESLFSYSGGFMVEKVVLYDATSRLTASIEQLPHTWRSMSKSTDTWALSTSVWQTYAGNSYSGVNNFAVNKKGANIITKNIKSTSGNLVLKDGTAYDGDAHYNSAGYFMTGASYSEDSVRLYRKNGIRINKRRRNG